MSAQPLLISGLVKTFGGARALDGVDLELQTGEVLGVLGPNGAGKSTMVRAVMGRVAADAGSILIFGTIAVAGDPVPRLRIGFVPQEIALYPLLTVKENLIVFGRYQGLSGGALSDAIDRSLEWAALAERAADQVKKLSGGMKRRLNIAAGVLHRPRVLMLDEPTVGVDPQSRERIYSMIESLREDGVSLIYTTHYMEEAERLCDRIAVMDHGKVIASGTKDELVKSTVGTGREIRIEVGNDIPPHLGQELIEDGAVVDDKRITFFSDLPAQDVARLIGRLAEEAITVADLSIRTPTLERVFLHLTGRELRE
ncbi:MAG TPA: ABC transporter ATP-binding protein [Thermoanaerobaculia bacterium]|nr:ABC transporter ATP-binding protein [Thermoanaerobaculia bacterium]